MFDHNAAGVAFGIEGGVVVSLPVGGAAIAGDVGLDFMPGALLLKVVVFEIFV